MGIRSARRALTVAAAVLMGALGGLVFIPSAEANASRCVRTDEPSHWGSYYTKTYCHTWHSSHGLQKGGWLGTGVEWVVCQQEGTANPAYGGHHNHWWVWTLGDNHIWDWYPETAFVEGPENGRIGGIPDCGR